MLLAEPAVRRFRRRGRFARIRRAKHDSIERSCHGTLLLGLVVTASLATAALVPSAMAAQDRDPAPHQESDDGEETQGAETSPDAREASPARALAQAMRDLEASRRQLDTVTFVLGGLSIFLVVFSLIISLAGVFGWSSLQGRIREDVKAQADSWKVKFASYNEQVEASIRELEEKKQRILTETQGAIGAAKEELEARLNNAMALVFGRLCRDEKDFLKVKRRDFLEKAIDFANQAYEVLGERPGGLNSPHQWSALNNLTFYRALEGDPSYADGTLADAAQLRRRCLEHGGKFYYLTTYIRVVGQFCRHAPDPLRLLEEAEHALQTLRSHPRIGKREVEEAEQYSTWLAKVKRRLLKERKGA